MSTRALVFGILAAVAGSLAIAFSANDGGDWPSQAYPAVSALAHGEPGRFLELQPVYGSFAALVEAPFLALSFALGGGELLGYQLSVLPCLLALSLLALTLGRAMHERGARPLACVVVSSLVLVNPATLAAIELGHPEELLCAALAVGSVLAAAKGRPGASALMLGLAIATKQWALIAVAPVLLAAPVRSRLRLALTGAAVAAVLLAPLALANPDRFATNTKAAQGGTATVSRYSAWWPAAQTEVRTVRVGEQEHAVTLHRLPAGVTGLGRPAAVVLGLALTLVAWRRGRRTGDDALALLALALLLRCILDPNDNEYYHLPVLVSLLAWESRRRLGLPLLAPLAAVALWASFEQPLLGHAALDNAFYLGWAIVIAGSLAVFLYAAARPLGLGSRLGNAGREVASAPYGRCPPVTTRCALLGYPVEHSRSPAMQNAAFHALGLDWSYEAIAVEPERFVEVVRDLVEQDYAGANVTIPHKLRALGVADTVSDVARAVGAANTLAFRAGSVAAHNTDVEGFLAALAQVVPEAPRGMRALVLGAGGAARAVVYALLSERASIVEVWNRHPARARSLVADLEPHRGRAALRAVPDPEASLADLIVNATSVGMGPREPPPGADMQDFKELRLSADDLGDRQVIVDLVYRDGDTVLVRKARARGLRCVDGLDVLVHQGAASFELWTGRSAPLEAMRDGARDGKRPR